MIEVMGPGTITAETIAAICTKLNILLPDAVYIDDYWIVESGIDSNGKRWESLTLYCVGDCSLDDLVAAQMAIADKYPKIFIELRRAWW